MTGYTVHTGSNENFVEGWDRIFGGKKPKGTSAQPRKAGTAKKSAKSPSPGKHASSKRK